MVTSPPFVTSYLFFPFGKTGVSAVGELSWRGGAPRVVLQFRSSLTYSGDVGERHALRRTLGPPPAGRRETPPQRKALPTPRRQWCSPAGAGSWTPCANAS